jgi:hypothetical protein
VEAVDSGAALDFFEDEGCGSEVAPASAVELLFFDSLAAFLSALALARLKDMSH